MHIGVAIGGYPSAYLIRGAIEIRSDGVGGAVIGINSTWIIGSAFNSRAEQAEMN